MLFKSIVLSWNSASVTLKILLVVFMERKYFSKLLLVPFIVFLKRNVQDEFKMMSFLFFEIVVLKAIFWKLAFEGNFLKYFLKSKTVLTTFLCSAKDFCMKRKVLCTMLRFLHGEEGFMLYAQAVTISSPPQRFKVILSFVYLYN